MLKYISWFLVVVWMIFIFNLSAQVAKDSNQLSTQVTEIVVKTVEKVNPKADMDIESFNHIIRKNAHFFAYLILGFFVANALRANGIYGYKIVIIGLSICIVYAITDELHQLFVPGRGAQVKDVIIDCAGSIVGYGTYEILRRLFFKFQRSQ